MTGDGKAGLFEQLATVGKAFANAKRLELLELLGQGERTVEALAHAADLGVSTTSAHLQILKLANVVTTRRDGTRIHYRLAGDDVAALYTALGAVARHHCPDVERAHAAYLGLRDARHRSTEGSSSRDVDDVGDVEEVTRDELTQRMADGSVLLVDVRPGEEYAAGHIPGALSLPFGDLLDGLADLPDGTDVVAYCRGAYCVLAHDAVRLLHAHGRAARRLQDGLLEWRLDGRPLQVGA